MIVCVALSADGSVGGGWGRADRVAVARVDGDALTSWQEFDVGWRSAHDSGAEGAHHARIARFLIDHAVEVVVTGHMGPGMERMLDSMKIAARTGVSGPARAAAVAAAQSPR